MQIIIQKCQEIFSKWSYVQLCSANLSNLDIKYNNLSFGDPNWVIQIGEETLEP